MRLAGPLILLLLLQACAAQDLTGAVARFPVAVAGPGSYPATGAGPFPPACPGPGGLVERIPGPPTAYLGADPADPELCRMRIGDHETEGYFGIWLKEWPGSAEAHAALRQVIHGPSGTTASFDTRAAPGYQWHGVLRNDGIEDLAVAGGVHPAMKLSHYREGFEGNTYRSVVTVWKDMRTGMIIYVRYFHISGTPEHTAWDPTLIRDPD
ncbi:MAG: hypothetical protein WDN49_02850 [Acetobacteraceae bacterium]